MLRKNMVKKYKSLGNGKKNINVKSISIVLIVIIIFIIISFFIKFSNNTAKSFKIGNNSSSQEVVDYILNISSYEATIDIEVNSNKNTNKYRIKQEYKKDGINMQEVLEPTNIAGVMIKKDGDTLKIENTNLNLSNVFEKYNYISDNALDLEAFIENFKNNPNSKYEEKNDQIIMKTIDNSNEKSTKNKTLYIEKTTEKPIQMEIEDNNKNTTIYIKYIEVNVNS